MARKKRRQQQGGQHGRQQRSSQSGGASFAQPLFIIAGFGVLCLALLSNALIDLSGHDFGYFLPKMLDIHLFYLQNGLAWQEYTAGLCAGVFQFANPQSMALALPQGLSYVLGPLRGIQSTFVITSLLSGGGIYLCARYWGLGRMAACMAAAAMAFNGFLLTRLAIGHLAFYGFGFAPAIAAALLYGIGAMAAKQAGRAAALCALAALLVAVLIYGGIGVMLLHTAAAVGLILLICGGFERGWHKAVGYCLACAALGLLAAAPKIEAVLAMNANLTRDFYALPGFGFGHTLQTLFDSLFWAPNEATVNQRYINNQFYMGWHEIYYGFTPVMLLALVLGFLGMVGDGQKGAQKGGQRGGRGQKQRLLSKFAAPWRNHPLSLGLLTVALLLCFALNVYAPGWNDFIKSLPLLGQFSGMTRFFALFIPVLALFLGWTVNHWRRIPAPAVLLFIAAMAFVQYQTINGNLRGGMYYDRIGLNGQPVQTAAASEPLILDSLLDAWDEGHAGVQPLREVVYRSQQRSDGSTGILLDSFADYRLINGQSNAGCYEPLFGYRLEQYRLGSLQPGPLTLEDAAGNLNLKNPACYVYPEANGCAPGDHFKTGQMQQMLALADYQDPQLAVSDSRATANLVGIGTLLALLGYLLLWGAWTRLRS